MRVEKHGVYSCISGKNGEMLPVDLRFTEKLMEPILGIRASC